MRAKYFANKKAPTGRGFASVEVTYRSDQLTPVSHSQCAYSAHL